MLRQIRIKNVAIAKDCLIELAPGLNILTGETGAGKSLLVGALEFLLGGKADPELIRTGADKAEVEAGFELTSNIAQELTKSYPEFSENTNQNKQEFFLRRELIRDGRSRAYLNGTYINLKTLIKIGDLLVDMHGQHEHQSLLKVEQQTDFLDIYADAITIKKQVETFYHNWQKTETERKRVQAHIESLKQQRDFLNFQLQELDRAKLKVGEEKILEQKQKLLAAAQKLIQTASDGYQILYSKENSIIEQLEHLIRNFESVQEIDQSFTQFQQTVKNCSLELEELAFSLRAYTTNLQAEPQALEAVEARLALIHNLKRKYTKAVEELIQYQEKIRADLKALQNQDELLEPLLKQEKDLLTKLKQIAQKLTEKRNKVAAKLASEVEKRLSQLQMPKTKFSIKFNNLNEDPDSPPSPRGYELAEFFISPNPGEDPKRLRNIASGGEISRIMLAIKSLIAEAKYASGATDIASSSTAQIPILVFDEIDAGIGGKASEAVGQKLRELALYRQVICITHQAQIARYAQHHLLVSKSILDTAKTFAEITELQVQVLDAEQRVEELARMLSGKEISKISLDHARELLK